MDMEVVRSEIFEENGELVIQVVRKIGGELIAFTYDHAALVGDLALLLTSDPSTESCTALLDSKGFIEQDNKNILIGFASSFKENNLEVLNEIVEYESNNLELIEKHISGWRLLPVQEKVYAIAELENYKNNELIVTTSKKLIDGQSQSEVFDDLTKTGVDTNLAKEAIAQGKKVKQEANLQNAKITLLLGAGLAGIGTLISSISYASASGGGSFVITTGLILVGGWLIIKGLWQLASSQI